MKTKITSGNIPLQYTSELTKIFRTTTHSTSIYADYCLPSLQEVRIKDESIEIIFKQYLMRNPEFGRKRQTRCFKLVFSCVKGKWSISKPIYGVVVEQKEESYRFPKNNKK